MPSKKFYIVETISDIDPVLHGPFSKEKNRDEAVLQLRRNDPEKENGLFWLNMTPTGRLKIGAYSGGYMDKAFDDDEENEVG